jgi:hypothetical protein
MNNSYIELPPELIAIAAEHFTKTAIPVRWIMPDTAGFQLNCAIPQPDEPNYHNEVSYYLRWTPDKPLRYFCSESWSGSGGDWMPWVSVDDAIAKTQEFITAQDFLNE